MPHMFPPAPNSAPTSQARALPGYTAERLPQVRTFLPSSPPRAAIASAAAVAAEDGSKKAQREVEFERRRAEFQLQQKDKEVEKLRRLLATQRDQISEQKTQLALQERNLMEYQRMDNARAHDLQVLSRRIEQRAVILEKHLEQAQQERDQIVQQNKRQVHALTRERNILAAALATIASQLKAGNTNISPGRSRPRDDASDTQPRSLDTWSKIMQESGDAMGSTERLNTKRKAFQGDATKAVDAILAQVKKLQDAVARLQQQLSEKDHQIGDMAQERQWVQNQYQSVDDLLHEVLEEALHVEAQHDAGTIHTALTLAPKTLAGKLQGMVVGLKLLFQELAVRDRELKKHQARLAELEFYRTLQARTVNNACQRLSDSGALANMARHLTSPPSATEGIQKTGNLAPVFERLYQVKSPFYQPEPTNTTSTPSAGPAAPDSPISSNPKLAPNKVAAPKLMTQARSFKKPASIATAAEAADSAVAGARSSGTLTSPRASQHEIARRTKSTTALQSPGKIPGMQSSFSVQNKTRPIKPAADDKKTEEKAEESTTTKRGKMVKSLTLSRDRSGNCCTGVPAPAKAGKRKGKSAGAQNGLAGGPSFTGELDTETSNVSLMLSVDENDFIHVKIQEMAAAVANTAAVLGVVLDADEAELETGETDSPGPRKVRGFTQLESQLEGLERFLGHSAAFLGGYALSQELEESAGLSLVEEGEGAGEEDGGLMGMEGQGVLELLQLKLHVVDERVHVDILDRSMQSIKLPGFDHALLQIHCEVVGQDSDGAAAIDAAVANVSPCNDNMGAGTRPGSATVLGRVKLWCEVVGEDVKLTITQVRTTSRASTPTSKALSITPSASINAKLAAGVGGSLVGGQESSAAIDTALLTIQCEMVTTKESRETPDGIGSSGGSGSLSGQIEGFAQANAVSRPSSPAQLITLMCEVLDERVVVSLLNAKPVTAPTLGSTLSGARVEEEDVDGEMQALNTNTLVNNLGETSVEFPIPGVVAVNGAARSGSMAKGGGEVGVDDPGVGTLLQCQGTGGEPGQPKSAVPLIHVQFRVDEGGALKLTLVENRSMKANEEELALHDGQFDLKDGIAGLGGVEAGSASDNGAMGNDASLLGVAMSDGIVGVVDGGAGDASGIAAGGVVLDAVTGGGDEVTQLGTIDGGEMSDTPMTQHNDGMTKSDAGVTEEGRGDQATSKEDGYMGPQSGGVEDIAEDAATEQDLSIRRTLGESSFADGLVNKSGDGGDDNPTFEILAPVPDSPKALVGGFSATTAQEDEEARTVVDESVPSGEHVTVGVEEAPLSSRHQREAVAAEVADELVAENSGENVAAQDSAGSNDVVANEGNGVDAAVTEIVEDIETQDDYAMAGNFADGRATVADSTTTDSTAADSIAADSTAADSTAVDSTEAVSTAVDSTEADSTAVDSTEEDGTAVNSTTVDSTKTDSTVVNNTEADSTAVDSTEANSTAADSTEADSSPAIDAAAVSEQEAAAMDGAETENTHELAAE